MENLYLLAFGTFGHPNDFRQTIFSDDKYKIGKDIKTFDLNINAIKIFPDGKLYALRKEIINGLTVISYSIYSYAKEQNSTREGTFIGSSFVFVNELPEENFTLNKLNEFHKGLINNNLEDQTLKVKHSQDFLVPKIDDIDKFTFNTRPIPSFEDFKSIGTNLLLLTRLDNATLQKKIKLGIELLNIYDVIFFTDDKQIAEFVRTKNIYLAVDESGFEVEIQKFHAEKKNKIQSVITEFEKEKQKIVTEKDSNITAFQKIIDANEVKQASNGKKIAESKSTLLSFNKVYDDYLKKLDESVKSAKTNPVLAETLKKSKDIRRNFEEEKRNITIPEGIQPFPTSRISNNRSTQNENNDPKFGNEPYKRDQHKKKKTDYFKVVSFLLNLILIGAVAYLIISSEKEKSQTVLETVQNNDAAIDSASVQEIHLNPLPNDSLSAKDYRLIAQKLDTNNIKEIVKIIFEKNPENIGSVYKYQKQDYEKLLFEKNKKSFKIFRDTIFNGKDSIKIIPAFHSKK